MFIKITEDMQSFARRHQDRILSRLKDENYTGYTTKDSFYYGTLGELTFIEGLKQLGKRADYLPPADQVDNEDVVVYLKDNSSVNINIKTASQSYHQFIILYPKQLNKYNHRQECYFAVRLENNLGHLMGYFLKDNLETFKFAANEEDRYRIYLNKLQPLDKMLAKIKDGETKIVLPY